METLRKASKTTKLARPASRKSLLRKPSQRTKAIKDKRAFALSPKRNDSPRLSSELDLFAGPIKLLQSRKLPGARLIEGIAMEEVLARGYRTPERPTGFFKKLRLESPFSSETSSKDDTTTDLRKVSNISFASASTAEQRTKKQPRSKLKLRIPHSFAKAQAAYQI